MDSAHILELLKPYLGEEHLSDVQVGQIAHHLELLQKWNAKTNLTSVRNPEEIVVRHFGESLFTARHLFPDPSAKATLADVGSGAGFPGLPIAIARPNVEVTLIEAHGKKATFLKEVVRCAGLTYVKTFAERAEKYHGQTDVVTLRAVEQFSTILPISARIVLGSGRLAALLGEAQVSEAERVIGEGWLPAQTVYFPDSSLRVLWIAQHR